MTKWKWDELRSIPNVVVAKLYAIEKFPSILGLGEDRLRRMLDRYPPPLIFLLPRKRAIALFSIFAGLVAEMEHQNPPASFDLIADFFEVDLEQDLQYYLRYRLCLYKLVAPVRHLLGLPQRTDPYRYEVSLSDAEAHLLMRFSSPASIMREIYNIAKLHNIRGSVIFTYSLVHTLDRIARYLRMREEGLIHRSIDYLARRYRSILGGLY